MTSSTKFVLDQNAEPLSDEELKAAITNDHVLKYRQVVRTMQDPAITNQGFTNLSFMLFDTPRKTKHGKPLYGFVKSRGAWPDDLTAEREGKRIVKDVDSKFPVRIAPTGSWVAITDDNSMVKDIVDVASSNNEENELRTDAIREKDAERRRIMREIRDREEECKNNDTYDDPTSLRFYSMKRVTEMKLRDEVRNRIKQIQSIKESLTETRNLCKNLEATHPDYHEQWIECYNIERARGGVPEFVPADDEFEEYDKYVSGPNVPLQLS